MIKTFGFLVGVAWSWCGSEAPACSPLSGPETDDTAVLVACDGCRQKYYSDMGLPDGVTFEACVTASTASVRAKLASDPHRYDAIVPKLRRHP